MKISLYRNDILELLSRVKQIKRVDSLEFCDKTIICEFVLNKKVLGIRGVPENWKVELSFNHSADTVTATLNIISAADLKLGGIVNNIAQGVINGIISAAGLEQKLISLIKLPEFIHAEGKSLTIDLKKLLQDKLDCTINALDCGGNALNIDIDFSFNKGFSK
jgi:hypothetical protein